MNRKRSMTGLVVLAAVALIAMLLASGQLNVVARAQEATPTPEPPATPLPSPEGTGTPSAAAEGQAALAPLAGATRVREADGAVMVYVPAGEFLMGSSILEGAYSEWPQRIIYLDSFWMDRTEVTNRQFESFAQATGYRTQAEKRGYGNVYRASAQARMVDGADWRHPEGPDSDIVTRGDYPAVQVDWNDSQAYCEWAGAHLPTEAEWEKAACGTDGRRYPWGSQQATCDYAVLTDNKGAGCGQGARPWPVGSKPEGASPYGAVDMSGNVFEWVADRYAIDYYAHSAASNPPGPDAGVDRVARSSSWWDPIGANFHVCAARDGHPPDDLDNTAGFRCAVSAPAAAAPAAPATTMATPPARRVLFIGDSDSWFLDRYLPRLAASGHPPITTESKALAAAGASLGAYDIQGMRYPEQEIDSGSWNVVVLEQEMDTFWQIADKFCDNARRFDDKIRQAGAEAVLFMPWDNLAIAPPPTLQDTADVYSKCGTELGVKVAPVGLAFERAAAERPDLGLYIADGTHANQRGLYLALSVLYATLFERSPVGLTYRMDDVAPTTLEYTLWDLGKQKDSQLSQDDAAFLQRTAWETVQAYQAGQAAPAAAPTASPAAAPSPAAPPRGVALNGVWGSSASDVFVVGDNGTIVHYDGKAWSPMSSGTYYDLSTVWGSSGSDVFAVGDGGTILHYDGSAWSAVESGVRAYIVSVWGSSGSDVFAVGDGGTILHYDGKSWSAMQSGIPIAMFCVWGSSNRDVFVGGSLGTVLNYDGTVWSVMKRGSYNSLYGMWGSAGHDVFVVGQSGTILHYDGSTWSAMNSGTADELVTVWGSSGSNVFAVGDSGTILHYDGSAWFAMSSGTANEIYAVWGSSASDVFAVGDGGTIVHYDGKAWSAMAH